MNILRDIQTLSNFKREAANVLKQIHETKEPVILTVNGVPSAVVQDPESYQELVDIKEQMETFIGVQLGLESMRQGKGKSLEEFDADFRKRHNFPVKQ
jgi:prevent-host-death family protein